MRHVNLLKITDVSGTISVLHRSDIQEVRQEVTF
jgi:hypothetical protein